MKSILSVIIGVGIFLWVDAASAKEVTQDFSVQGWSCEGCCGKTEKAVQEVKGVKSAKADYEKKLVRVTFDDATAKPEAIKGAIEKAGFGCPMPKNDKDKGSAKGSEKS